MIQEKDTTTANETFIFENGAMVFVDSDRKIIKEEMNFDRKKIEGFAVMAMFDFDNRHKVLK